MKNVAIYLRCSTDKQSTDHQKRQLVEFCRSKGWEIVATYVDEAVSGSRAKRPGLDKLMETARLSDGHGRNFNIVLVYSFDRFARSTRHLLQALDTFNESGIDFCSMTQSIDTTTPMGKFFFTVVAAFSEFDLSIIRERVKSGVANARAAGKRIGRPKVVLDRMKIYSMRNPDRGVKPASWKQIAKALQADPSTVRRAYKEVKALEKIKKITNAEAERNLESS